VTAGDKPAANLDVVVVDHADALAPIQPAPTTIAPNNTAQVCFAATSSGRFIVGLSWTFQVDGVAKAGSLNCVDVSTTKTSGTVSVMASAGGQQASVSLAVGAMARQPLPQQGMIHRTPTAGDRAAM
jgi:hypothetical protein